MISNGGRGWSRGRRADGGSATGALINHAHVPWRSLSVCSTDREAVCFCILDKSAIVSLRVVEPVLMLAQAEAACTQAYILCLI